MYLDCKRGWDELGEVEGWKTEINDMLYWKRIYFQKMEKLIQKGKKKEKSEYWAQYYKFP